MLGSMEDTEKQFKMLYLEKGKGLMATLNRCLVASSTGPQSANRCKAQQTNSNMCVI